MPSGGGMKPSTAVSGGHISPQWGWYISTTPPPLEKYSDPKHAKNKPQIIPNLDFPPTASP